MKTLEFFGGIQMSWKLEFLICEFNSYINSLGVGGEIPSTFANLENMQVM